jgi:uncharacterized protein (DUF4213/DUF364 family)
LADAEDSPYLNQGHNPIAAMTSSDFAHELLALLTDCADRTPLPRVKALHLPPPDATGKDAEFCALELDDGSLGLSYVMLDDTLQALIAVRDEGGASGLAGLPALELARAFASGQGATKALGFAAVNAISQCVFARAGYAFDEDTDSIGQLDPQPGDHVGMIGFFPPLVGRIVATGARLTVAELNPDHVGERDGYRVTLDATELEACNKVLSTSTVLLNDTLDAVLAHGRNARWFAMVGPGAGLLPDPLFARGVTLLGGARVVDRDGFVAAIAEGRKWGSHVRKYVIDRARYPGAGALLAAC